MLGTEHSLPEQLQSATSFPTPRAPPNDPERRGNIWQQHEQLQAMYQQLMDQNSQLVTERTQYQHDKRQTENAVGMLLQENHNLHQHAGQPHIPPSTTNSTSEHAGSVTSDHPPSRIYNQAPSNRFQRFNSFKSDNLVSPRAALQSIFPGKFNGLDHSPDNSSQGESYDQQYPAQQQYYSEYQQAGAAGSAIDQLGQLRAELAGKDEQIVHLQHSLQGLRQKSQSLQYTVDDADSHRRQVQSHNGELQMQLDSLLSEMEALRQGHSWGSDPNHLHQLTQDNAELNAQLAELTHKLDTREPETQGLSEQEEAQLRDRLAQLESDNSELNVKLQAVESQLRHEHSRELRRIESEKENRLLELKGEHETLISLLTEQNERLELELKEALETARIAAAAAASSPMPSGSPPTTPTTPRDLSAEDERKVQGLKATILQLVEENKSLTRAQEHNSRLKHEVQQMMKVKAEREDVRQENTKLQSDLRKLQRTLDAKLAEPAANTEADKKLQEQLQVVSQEKAGLQEQVQQLQQQASLTPVPQQPTAEKGGGAQGYPQTWKLVDQLRNQNRQLIAEVTELRGSGQGQGQGQGMAAEGPSMGRATSGSLLRRLGLKKPKDRQLPNARSSAALPEPAQADSETLSSSSFNEGEGSVELSNQSQAASVDQAAPSEKAVEELLEVADERVCQAEQRAIKAEEASQAQEGLISQLCDENLKLGEEVQRLNSGMKLVQDLTEENSRLIRDNKRANASLDSMVKDIAELNNRLFDIALQSPHDGGDIFDDAFADPAEEAERAEKKKEAAAAASGGSSDAGAGRALGGMDSAMKKRQEETAAEVKARDETLAKDEERHQQLKEESKKQLETFDRVKEKMSSSSTPFSLARQRLQRANTGLNGRPPSAGKSEAGPSTTEAEVASITPRSPFQAASSRTPDRTRTSPMRTSRPELTPDVDLSPSKQSPVSPVANRGPAARQTPFKAPVNPPLSHPALSALSSSKQQAEPQKASGLTGVGSAGGPLTPERLPSGRMMSGRLPSGLAMTDGEPGQNLKPISTARSLTREGSLTRSESGNERLRQEAENSRAEIWRKIQTAKLNNSQKQQAPSFDTKGPIASPTSPTQGLVTQSPAPAPAAPSQRAAAPQPSKHGSVQDQVDEAYLQFGPAHDIVRFMQSLGYTDFRTARQGEEKMEQFKRALKLTRPAFAATRSPMQQEMASAVYKKLQSWVDQFVYKR